MLSLRIMDVIVNITLNPITLSHNIPNIALYLLAICDNIMHRDGIMDHKLKEKNMDKHHFLYIKFANVCRKCKLYSKDIQ